MPARSLLCVLVPALGLLEIAAHQFFAHRAPTEAEWRDVAPVVASLREKGEPVLIAPHWGEPLARMAFGDPLFPLDQLARADMTPFAGAIEVSSMGETATEVAGWPVAKEKRHGPFVIRTRVNPEPARVRYDFVDEIAKASVSSASGTAEQPCRWTERARHTAGGLHGHPAYPSQRHDCTGPEHQFVGVTIVEDQDWKPRRCVWAHPLEGKRLVVRYSDVPLGTVIRGYASLPWWVEREKKGAPVELEVRAGGTSLGTYVHEDGDGWKLFEFPTGREGRRTDVEFRISSRSTRERQFCFAADTR